METWERRTGWLLSLLAVVFLVVWAWPILDPSMPRHWVRVCDGLEWGIWVVFGVDVVVRLWLAPRRREWLMRHVLDVVVLVLPMLRPLRVLRVIMLMRILGRTAAIRLRGRVLVYAVGGAVMLAFLGALAALSYERGVRGSNLDSFGSAIWWACTTMTTVGYGDHYPVTFGGRVVAVVLMIGGIALIGAVAAAVASWLIDAVQEEEEEALDELALLRIEVAQLRAIIESRLPLFPEPRGSGED